MTSQRRALVLGGSGTVGREVVRQLSHAGLEVAFGYHKSAAAADVLRRDLAAKAIPVDLRDGAVVRRAVADPWRDGRPADILVHAAAVLHGADGAGVTDAELAEMASVHVLSAYAAVQAFASANPPPGDVVLVTALDKAQSIPIPAGFAATQGAIGPMAMALAKELGPRGHRVNAIALGLLDRGLSLALPAALRDDYLRYSALRRFGSVEEAAKAVVWLALENTYMSGKVLAVTGGL